MWVSQTTFCYDRRFYFEEMSWYVWHMLSHKSIFNYDLISICETSLNDSVELPETQFNDYTFAPVNNPANTQHGRVGLFFKNSLPVIFRNDSSFDQLIVVELKFGWRFKPLCQILKLYIQT